MSAFFDYIIHGGDELARAKACEEYALNTLARALEIEAELLAKIALLEAELALCKQTKLK